MAICIPSIAFESRLIFKNQNATPHHQYRRQMSRHLHLLPIDFLQLSSELPHQQQQHCKHLISFLGHPHISYDSCHITKVCLSMQVLQNILETGTIDDAASLNYPSCLHHPPTPSQRLGQTSRRSPLFSAVISSSFALFASISFESVAPSICSDKSS